MHTGKVNLPSYTTKIFSLPEIQQPSQRVRLNKKEYIHLLQNKEAGEEKKKKKAAGEEAPKWACFWSLLELKFILQRFTDFGGAVYGLQFHFVILFHGRKSHTACKTEKLIRILWCLPASIFTQQSQHEMKDSVAKGNVEDLQKLTAGDGITSAVQKESSNVGSLLLLKQRQC